MRCSNGHAAPDGANYCPECAVPITGRTPSAPWTTPALAGPPPAGKRSGRTLLIVGVVVGVLMIIASVATAVTIATQLDSDTDELSVETGGSSPDVASGDFVTPGDAQLRALDEMSALFTRISANATTSDLSAVLAACREGASSIPEWRALLVPALDFSATPHIEAALDHYETAFSDCEMGDLSSAASEMNLGAEEMNLATAALTPAQ